MKFLKIIGLSILLCLWQQSQAADNYKQVKVANTMVMAKVSDTDATRIRGLQHVAKLSNQEGMLFVYPEQRVLAHWMKEMKIPLDMIWIDQDKVIVNITENAPVCTKDPCAIYSSGKPALYVLEVNSGFAKKHHLQPGMKLEF